MELFFHLKPCQQWVKHLRPRYGPLDPNATKSMNLDTADRPRRESQTIETRMSVRVRRPAQFLSGPDESY